MTPEASSFRRAVGAFVAAATVAAVVLTSHGSAGAAGPGSEAVLRSGAGFVRNQYAEAGSRANGSIGSDVAQPTSWHGNFAKPRPWGVWSPTNDPTKAALGMRSDRDRDGWGVGRDDGDFTQPGQAYEGWFLQTTGDTLRNLHYQTDVPGGFVSSDTVGNPSVTWDSPDDSSGLRVHQTMSVPDTGGQTVNLDVTLTNPGGSPVNARYARGADPNNCYQYDSVILSVCPVGIQFRTTNTILAQRRNGDAQSAVKASAEDGSSLVLWTSEPDSTAVSFFSDWGNRSELDELHSLPLTYTPAAMYMDPTGVESFNQVGTTSGYDTNGVMVIVQKTVPANGSVTFRISYSLSQPAFDEATAAGAVTLTEGPLDVMTVGAPFSFDLSTTGLTTPAFAVSAGALPAGLALDPSTGSISGTPTTVGPYDFSVTASGTEGAVTQQYTGTVEAVPGVAPTWTANTLSTLVAGQPATGTNSASGDGPITYLILGALGDLPEGLTIDTSTGAITGTPTTPGPYSFTVAATNEFGFVTQQFLGVVGAAPAWTDSTLAAPTAGRPYSNGVTASGTGPVTYAVTAGRLPAGLTLNPATGAVTGTPTAAGPALFVITATNAYGSTTQGFGMAVAAAPTRGVMGAVAFIGTTGRLQPEGRRALDLLAAAVPRGATNVQVQVFGWAEAKRTTRAVLQLGATRVKVTTAELKRRGVAGVYSGKVGGRYPVPGRTGRRSEVVITWDN